MNVTDSKTIKKQIRDFIVEVFMFGDESEAFEDSDSFMNKGIIDSTGVLELVAFLEEKFGVMVGDEEMVPTNLDSIDNLAAFIQKKKA